MKWEKFKDNVFWLLLISTVGYGVNQLGGIKDSMALLNEKIAVVIYQTSDHQKRLDDQDARIRHVEERLLGRGRT